MTRRIALVAAVLIPLIALAGSDRLESGDRLIKLLNGSEQLLGIIRVADGGCANNLTNRAERDGGFQNDGGTSATFAIDAGSFIMVQCCTDSRVMTGTGSSTTALGSGQSVRLNGQTGSGPYCIGERKYTFLRGTENAVSVCPLDGGTAEGCSIFGVQ